MKRRLVIVSHVFPPAQHANAKRPHMLAKYLVREGWQVTVLTSAFATNGSPVLDTDGIRVECLPAWPIQWLECLHRLPRMRLKLITLFQGLLVPDLFVSWARRVARRLREIPYDRGILSVLPYSAFCLADMDVLSSRWTIDFQESIYPFLKSHGRTSPLQKRFVPHLIAMEKRALDQCGRVWFTSNENRKHYISENRVEEVKTAHVPYFYDPELYPRPKARTEARSEWTMVYGGQLDGTWRSPKTFLEAWASLRKQTPNAGSALRLHVYGVVWPEVLAMAADLGLAQQILIKKPVAYPDFLRAVSEADALLYIDGKNQRLFNPSKLADYFGSGQPILSFTESGSEVEAMLSSVRMRAYTARLDDKEGGMTAMLRLWELHDNHRVSSFDSRAFSMNEVCRDAEALLSLPIE